MKNMIKYQTEDFSKNLSIDIGAKHSFKNYENIKTWCNDEINYLKEIGNVSNSVNTFISNVKNKINRSFTQNRNANFTINDLLAELKTLIEEAYKTHGLISSKSKEGIWLLAQHKANSSLTVGSFTYFKNKKKGGVNNNDSQRDGQFSAYLFDNNIEPNFNTEKEQYRLFYQDIIKQKDEILKELIDIREENKKLNKIIQEQTTKWQTTFETQKTEVQSRFDKEYDRHKSKMKESENFYEKKLAVKNAVTYWSTKAKSHKINSIIFGSVAGLLMIIAVVMVFEYGKYIIGLDLNDANGIGRKILTEKGALQLWVYGFFIISMTLVIWFIRLLVKIFLSNLHLLSDAKERETMIQTYLSFEREENTLKDTDRDLILPSIFRVSANGFIKDDATPNTPINIITKKFTG
ncbi:conserved hypothetical protein [Tenacibaculum litopenaei]|uniref:DUF6161 domain-containing protein n=1 Tax=Tenacibaculum litopenaei TaxID=396016 RepID=UPI0038953713